MLQSSFLIRSARSSGTPNGFRHKNFVMLSTDFHNYGDVQELAELGPSGLMREQYVTELMTQTT